MGLGSLKVDLRDVDLPPGRTDLRLELGMGEIQVLVPTDTCVTTDAHIGVGAVNVGEGEQGGIDFDENPAVEVAPGVEELHVIADVDVGAFAVGDSFLGFQDPADWGGDRFDALRTGTNRAACMGTA